VDRVFYLIHTDTPQELQEIATVIRSVVDIRQVAVVNEQIAVAVRNRRPDSHGRMAGE
jgi:hypothetical protein